MSHLVSTPCHDTLRLIFLRLSIHDLALAACVCREWCAIASDPDIVRSVFRSRWKLKDVIQDPVSSKSFWRDNSIEKFAISHKIVRGDTVAGLAVKYSVQVMDIKRLNNMMSEHGIHSRKRLLIPVRNPSLLVCRVCHIEMDVYAKREVAVLYLEDDRGFPNVVTSSEGKRKIIDSLKKSMRVDDATARYYLDISHGDPRMALSRFSSDLSWERHNARF